MKAIKLISLISILTLTEFVFGSAETLQMNSLEGKVDLEQEKDTWGTELSHTISAIKQGSTIGRPIRDFEKVIHRWHSPTRFNIDCSSDEDHILHQINLIHFFSGTPDEIILQLFDKKTISDVLRAGFFTFYSHLVINRKVPPNTLKDLGNLLLQVLMAKFETDHFVIPPTEYASIFAIFLHLRAHHPRDYETIKSFFENYCSEFLEKKEKIVNQKEWEYWNKNPDARTIGQIISFNISSQGLHNQEMFNGGWEYHPAYLHQTYQRYRDNTDTNIEQ